MIGKLTRSNLAISYALVIAGIAVILLFTNCSDDSATSSSLPEMNVWPMDIKDTSSVGDSNRESRVITVDCSPHAHAAFTFDCDDPWINLSNYAGTDGGTTRDSFAVTFSVSELPVGTYSGTVAVRSEGVSNSPQRIQVEYTVKARLPVLVVNPQTISFTASSHQDVPIQGLLSVTCGDGSEAEYALTEPADWIELTGADGTTPDAIVVAVDPSAVTTGAHCDTIWVSSTEMLESPKTVIISLTLPVWLPQTPAMFYPLKDVAFSDTQNGWAVGCIENNTMRDGFIMGTDDGGETWEVQLFISSDDEGEIAGFTAVEIAGETVWAVAESGIIRCTQNGGLSWEPRSTGLADTLVTLSDIEFVTDQIGWIVGQDGLILATTDGGDTWLPQTSGTDGNLYSVCFVDELTGWVAGSGNVILRTLDGGVNWTPLYSGLTDHRSVHFADANNGWVVAKEGGIAHTVDGGDNWARQESEADGWLQSVFFVDDSIGWIVGQSGMLLYTEDAGTTWTVQESFTTKWLNSVFFVNESTGWFVGDNGVIFYTSSGGK